ncbi:hypothetical protein DPMN_040038 [Dreissena polymorpha]|uniref:Uncharacterized protein n=1 Tax=Dreissena polymorpha TaxID=45954 RepID=A0A9D4CUH8_DREPO|nr:hypothetical protein DPMN_040038 [Dreissena polymorpha]
MFAPSRARRVVTHAGLEDGRCSDTNNSVREAPNEKNFAIKQRKSDREHETSDATSNEASATDTGSGKRVCVSEDFTEQVRKARSSLIPSLKESLAAGKNAYLRLDKLIVNGNSYVYDENKKRPVPSFK